MQPVIRADASDAKDGGQSLLVEATEPADIAIAQTLELPRGESLARQVLDTDREPPAIRHRGHGRHARDAALDNHLVAGAPAQFGTSPWREVSVSFRVPYGEGHLALFFVGFGKGTGRAWFDGVRLEGVESRGALPITGRAVRGWELLDAVMLDYRDRIGSSGATLAISRNGRLLYSRGYGWSDRRGRS